MIELPPLPDPKGVLANLTVWDAKAMMKFARAAVELNQKASADVEAMITALEDGMGGIRDKAAAMLRSLDAQLQAAKGMGTTDQYHEPGLGLNKGDY